MSKAKYNVRPASYSDFEDVMDLVMDFAEERVEVFTGKINQDTMTKLMEQIFGTSFVLTYEGRIKGVIAGTIVMSPFNGLPMFQEMIWYVHKAHRKYGLKLVRELENFCRIKGIKQLILGYIVGLNDKKMQNLYKRLGYEAMEVQFIKDV